jgi:hypothetical protein
MEQLFNPEDIKTFNPKELDNKTLHIKTIQNEGVTIVAGKDMETGIVYVLSTKINL